MIIGCHEIFCDNCLDDSAKCPLCESKQLLKFNNNDISGLGYFEFKERCQELEKELSGELKHMYGWIFELPADSKVNVRAIQATMLLRATGIDHKLMNWFEEMYEAKSLLESAEKKENNRRIY